MAESLSDRVKAALKEGFGQAAAERFGSAGRYVNSRLNDQSPESFRKIATRDFKSGVASRFGTLGRAIVNPEESKKNFSRSFADSVTSSNSRLTGEISGIKEQNTSIANSLTSVNRRLRRLDDKLEDMLLSQERIEITINRLLYKKEPPPVIEQTVNNVTNNVTNNITNSAPPVGGGGRGRGLGGGRGGAGRAALGLGAAGAVGAAAGAAGTSAVMGSGSNAQPSNATQGTTTPGASQSQSSSGVTPGSSVASTGGGRSYQPNQDARPAPTNFTGSNAEAFAKIEEAAKKAGSPDPKLTAAIAMLESGWLKSSMTARANNPFGQTIVQSQIGKDGIVGGTRGADGQQHAVYDSLESAIKHHIKRWGNRYSDDPQKTLSNLVAGGYNTVNPRWAPSVYSIYSGSNRNTAGGSTPQSGTSQNPTAAPTTGGSSPAPTTVDTNRQTLPQTPTNDAGVPTQTMSGVLPQHPSQTRGGGTDTQAMYPQDRASPEPWQGSRGGSERIGGGQRRQQGGMVTLKTPGGRPYQVAAEHADKFEGFVNELEGSGYKINSIGGYANRTTAAGGFSYHSKGMAIDINPSQNPHTFPGNPNYGKTDMPANISAMARKYGLGWGGDWRSSKDTMHFSAGEREGGSGGSGDARGGTMAGGENESRGGAGGSQPGGRMTASPSGGAGISMPGGRIGGGIGGMLGGGMMPSMSMGGIGMMGRGGMMPGMGMIGGMGMMGRGGLGGIGGMIGGMLGSRGGPAGGFIGSMLGSAVGNLAQSALRPVQPQIRIGEDIGRRSTEMSYAPRQQRSSTVGPQNQTTHTTPSTRRFGVDSIPTVTPTGGFAEVLGAGVAGALVEALGSNSISVNRRARAGSMVS